MAKPVVFGAFRFKTKKAATEEIRRRINRYEKDDKLNQDDQCFFEELFKLHEYGEKVGIGIKHIVVERGFHKNRCLYIHRVDGTRRDISWVHCIRSTSIKSTVSMGFRRAVKEVVTSFKSRSILEGSTCPILKCSLNFNGIA